MVNQLVIRTATIDDVAVLTELSVTTFRDKFGPLNSAEDMDMYVANEMNIDKLTAELADKDNLFFMAYYGEQPIGYAKLRTKEATDELRDKNAIELERLYVLQDHQSKKAGTALINYCLAYATTHKYDTMWLGVWEHNDGARRFYERLGFELFGSHPFVLGNDLQTDVLMKKNLIVNKK